MSVSVKLPDKLARRLQHLEDVTGHTKSFYMIEALKEHIEDLEDYYMAEKIMADIEAGRSKTYSLEEMVQRLGLED